MHILCRKAVLLFMLVTFVTSIGAYGLNPKWLTHELAHEHTFLPGMQDKDRHDDFSKAEHALWHALGHCMEGPCPEYGILTALPVGAVPIFLPQPEFHSAESEPLFRPPRSSFLS